MKNKNLKSILKEKMQLQEIGSLIKSYDIIGDIAIIRVPENLESQSQIIAEAIMQTHKHVKTVLRQASAVLGEYRLRQLEWVMGEKKTETVHKEFGCVFKVDLEKCYFSPRLSFERMRIAKLTKAGEVVVNMFAGVGAFSILMAKHSSVKKVYSIDINSDAVQYMHENIWLNRVQSKVVPILGDAKHIITERLRNVADRVIMPLPEKACEYLDHAIAALKPVGGWIHCYDFERARRDESPVDMAKVKVGRKLEELSTDYETVFGRVVRATGPYWYQVVLDICAHKK